MGLILKQVFILSGLSLFLSACQPVTEGPKSPKSADQTLKASMTPGDPRQANQEKSGVKWTQGPNSDNEALIVDMGDGTSLSLECWIDEAVVCDDANKGSDVCKPGYVNKDIHDPQLTASVSPLSTEKAPNSPMATLKLGAETFTDQSPEARAGTLFTTDVTPKLLRALSQSDGFEIHIANQSFRSGPAPKGIMATFAKACSDRSSIGF